MSEFPDTRGSWSLPSINSPLPGVVSRDLVNGWFKLELDCVEGLETVDNAISIVRQRKNEYTHLHGVLADGRLCTLFDCVPVSGRWNNKACTICFVVHMVLVGKHICEVDSKCIASASIQITNAEKLISGKIKVKRVTDSCDEICFEPVEYWADSFFGGEIGIFVGGSESVGWHSYRIDQEMRFLLKNNVAFTVSDIRDQAYLLSSYINFMAKGYQPISEIEIKTSSDDVSCKLFVSDEQVSPKPVHIADVMVTDVVANASQILKSINLWFALHQQHPYEINLYLKRFDNTKTDHEIFASTIPPLVSLGGEFLSVESAIPGQRVNVVVNFLCTYISSMCTEDEFYLVRGKLLELNKPYFRTVIEACVKDCSNFLAQYANEKQIKDIVKFSVTFRNIIAHPKSCEVTYGSSEKISLANSLFEIVFDWLVLQRLGFSREWIESRFADFVPYRRSEFCSLRRVLKAEETGQAQGDLSMLDDAE